METPASIFFFANGNVAVFDRAGQQMVRYQAGWHGTTLAALEADGIDWRTIPEIQGDPLAEPPDWWYGHEATVELDRLAELIDRAEEVLDVTPHWTGLIDVASNLREIRRSDLAELVMSAYAALGTLREILAAAEPEEPDRG